MTTPWQRFTRHLLGTTEDHEQVAQQKHEAALGAASLDHAVADLDRKVDEIQAEQKRTKNGFKAMLDDVVEVLQKGTDH